MIEILGRLERHVISPKETEAEWIIHQCEFMVETDMSGEESSVSGLPAGKRVSFNQFEMFTFSYTIRRVLASVNSINRINPLIISVVEEAGQWKFSSHRDSRPARKKRNSSN